MNNDCWIANRARSKTDYVIKTSLSVFFGQDIDSVPLWYKT